MSNSYRVAPYSVVAWVWTVGFIIGLLYFGALAILGISAGVPSTFDIGAAVILLVATVYAWIRSVRAYELGEQAVVIVRRGPGRITIPYDKILRAEFRPEIGAFFNTSIFGIGGVFGWSGKARVRNPTDVKSDMAEVFGTNAKNAVVLNLESGLVLIVTPSDAQGFDSALQEKMPRQRTRTITKIKRR